MAIGNHQELLLRLFFSPDSFVKVILYQTNQNLLKSNMIRKSSLDRQDKMTLDSFSKYVFAKP